MGTIEYIGLDIHRKSISYCRKWADREVIAEGRVAARADGGPPVADGGRHQGEEEV